MLVNLTLAIWRLHAPLSPFIRFRFRYDASQQQQQPISSGKSSPTSESDKNKAGQSEQSGESREETSGEVTGEESAEEENEEEDAEGDERIEDDTSTFPFFEWWTINRRKVFRFIHSTIIFFSEDFLKI